MAVSLLAWPGAIAIGVSLGLLGSGGSILTVPVLVYLLGQDEKLAIAGSLFVVGTIALAGSLQYLRAKLIDWRNVVIFGGPGMLGTYLGAMLAAYVSGIVQLSLFALVMLLASYFMLRPVDLEHGASPISRAEWKIAIDGLLVGVMTGLVGVGGGFLIVPALVLLGGMPMHRAVATSLVIIALKSYSGFYKYLDVLAQQDLYRPGYSRYFRRWKAGYQHAATRAQEGIRFFSDCDGRLHSGAFVAGGAWTLQLVFWKVLHEHQKNITRLFRHRSGFRCRCRRGGGAGLQDHHLQPAGSRGAGPALE